MDKKVLIISELFYPNNLIGALRPSKLCKFLLLKGYQVDVVTREKAQSLYAHENCRLYTIQERTGSYNDGVQAVKSKTLTAIRDNDKLRNNRSMKELRQLRRTILSVISAVKFQQEAMTLFYNRDINPQDYDACITSYGPLSSVYIGLALKRKYHIKNWICDFRDPIVVEDSSKLLRPYLLSLQNRSLKYADKVVTVSNGAVRSLAASGYERKIAMIPNGYDADDRLAIQDIVQEKGKLVFAYVGSLYGGKRKLGPLFKALAALNTSGEIDLSRISFTYGGTDAANALSQAAEYGLSHIVNVRGVLSREECLKLQYQSNFLVLSTWNTKKEQGVFTGKFLEYMMIGKPIIGIITGDCSGSEVAEVIEEGNLGIAFEEANEAIDFIRLKDYVKCQYDSYFLNGRIKFSPNQTIVDRYDYRNIVIKFEALIND